MPYYAVAKGKNTGVYNDWSSCKENVSNYSGARYKKFNSQQEAQAFVQSKGSYQSLSDFGGNSGSYSSYGHSSSQGSGSSSKGVHARGSATKPGSETRSSNISKPSKHIYTDGASRGNGKAGTPASGYGVYYGEGDSRNASVALNTVDDVTKIKPTNQRSELHAINHALDNIHKEIKGGGTEQYTVYTDSKYAQNSITTWSKNWESNGWKNSKGEPVANRDIIEKSIKTMKDINESYREKALGELEIAYVPGHKGVPGNEGADKLANEGADKMERSFK